MQFLLQRMNINNLKVHSFSQAATAVQLFQKDSTL